MSPRGGEISQSNPPLIPRLGLGLEMAAAEPGSLGAPARRTRLPLASPVLPRDCDPGGPAQPGESWSLRGPGTPSPARLRETVRTQVRPLVGGRRDVHWAGLGESQVARAHPLVSQGVAPSLRYRELFVSGRREEGVNTGLQA